MSSEHAYDARTKMLQQKNIDLDVIFLWLISQSTDTSLCTCVSIASDVYRYTLHTHTLQASMMHTRCCCCKRKISTCSKVTHWTLTVVLTINSCRVVDSITVCWRRIISWPWKLAYRSLKVIETDAIQKVVCGFLFAFYSKYGRICSHFGDIQRQKWPDLEIWVWVPSRSLKKARFDRPCMTFY